MPTLILAIMVETPMGNWIHTYDDR